MDHLANGGCKDQEQTAQSLEMQTKVLASSSELWEEDK